ncbi:MAG: hypothetical protein HQM06_04895 [Magnetococcales bacterium]|nr:hypothetical protein [Magnetococcales bacterium]
MNPNDEYYVNDRRHPVGRLFERTEVSGRTALAGKWRGQNVLIVAGAKQRSPKLTKWTFYLDGSEVGTMIECVTHYMKFPLLVGRIPLAAKGVLYIVKQRIGSIDEPGWAAFADPTPEVPDSRPFGGFEDLTRVIVQPGTHPELVAILRGAA